jgi:hypothetical protein
MGKRGGTKEKKEEEAEAEERLMEELVSVQVMYGDKRFGVAATSREKARIHLNTTKY